MHYITNKNTNHARASHQVRRRIQQNCEGDGYRSLFDLAKTNELHQRIH
jgi:hypothetical protein